MKRKQIIKSIIRDFHVSSLPEYNKREITIPLNSKKIIAIIGSRRCGKTFIVYQLIDELLHKIPMKQILLIDFEDERLELVANEMDLILQAYMELYPDLELNKCYFFFDEIQNIIGWEKFVRRIYDKISKNIYITGSNAKMLSSEISTSLRGRSLSYTVFPLSFREYLHFQNIHIDLYASKTKAQILNGLERYLHTGAYPELVFFKDPKLQKKILCEYFQVMMFRDLIERYNIKNISALRFFLKRLFASSSKQISVNKIYKDLKSAGLKVGKNTLYNFFENAEAIFLGQTLQKYSSKLSVREFGEKKFYVIDNGLINAIVFKFSSDVGKAMEQAVFWDLKRRGKKIYYYKNNFECDFIIFTDSNISDAIQVSYQVDTEKTKERELKGLVETCKHFNLKNGTIITFDTEDQLIIQGINIIIIPLAHFLLKP
ncbi:ATPase [Candidatus Magnetomoraceae bacterium gMMP-15]